MIELALGRDGATASPGTDARRVLQLLLAATWLLDGLLQYQSFMYTAAFAQMLEGTAAGNPGVIARPVNWNAALVEHHLVLLNTAFAEPPHRQRPHDRGGQPLMGEHRSGMLLEPGYPARLPAGHIHDKVVQRLRRPVRRG